MLGLGCSDSDLGKSYTCDDGRGMQGEGHHAPVPDLVAVARQRELVGARCHDIVDAGEKFKHPSVELKRSPCQKRAKRDASSGWWGGGGQDG